MNNAAQLLKTALILRPISKDELVTGYVVIRRNYGLESLANVIRRNSGAHYYTRQLSWLLPSNLVEISSLFGHFTGSAESLLLNNTAYPVLCRFLTPDDADILKRHYLYSSFPGIASKLGLTSMLNRGNSWRLAACRRCAAEDVTADGYPFWRREFIIPGIEYCAKHAEPLFIPCLKCSPDVRYARTASHPNSKCECSNARLQHLNRPSSKIIEHEIELASAIKLLLDPRYIPALSAESVSSAISARSTELGLVKNGHANTKEIQLFIDKHDAPGASVGAYFGGLSPKRLYSILTSRCKVTNAATAIRLLQALYGNWNEAELALSRLASFQQSLQGPELKYKSKVGRMASSPPRPPKRSLNEAEQYEIYLSFAPQYRALRQKFPDVPLSTLTLRLPDKAIRVFTRKNLMRFGESIPPNCFGSGYYQRLDESLASHIRTRHRELMEGEAPLRISRNLLLKGHKMASAWRRYEHHLSEAIMALAECEESASDYRRRKLLNIVLESKVPSVSLDDCDVVSTLDDTQVSMLLKEGSRR